MGFIVILLCQLRQLRRLKNSPVLKQPRFWAILYVAIAAAADFFPSPIYNLLKRVV